MDSLFQELSVEQILVTKLIGTKITLQLRQNRSRGDGNFRIIMHVFVFFKNIM